MVNSPGRTTDPRRIRRLKAPSTIDVEVDADGAPVSARIGGSMLPVTLARRPWRVDQHWWRAEPVRRTYYRLAIEGWPPVTVYRDDVSGAWHRQEY